MLEIYQPKKKIIKSSNRRLKKIMGINYDN
jgi:hypothetical protein